MFAQERIAVVAFVATACFLCQVVVWDGLGYLGMQLSSIEQSFAVIGLFSLFYGVVSQALVFLRERSEFKTRVLLNTAAAAMFACSASAWILSGFLAIGMMALGFIVLSFVVSMHLEGRERVSRVFILSLVVLALAFLSLVFLSVWGPGQSALLVFFLLFFAFVSPVFYKEDCSYP